MVGLGGLGDLLYSQHQLAPNYSRKEVPQAKVARAFDAPVRATPLPKGGLDCRFLELPWEWDESDWVLRAGAPLPERGSKWWWTTEPKSFSFAATDEARDELPTGV